MARETTSPLLKKWLEDVRKANRRVDLDYISHAYRFSEQAHRQQQRRSGEVFLTHPMAVALELASLHLDTTTVAAGLLHDILEDTPVNNEQLTEEFGPQVTFLVEGVTKIGGFRFRSREEVQAENFRKMLLSMAQDLRIILIKLADRLHNMRTIEHLDRRHARRIAHETIDIYVPLAHRFGINRIKIELENLALSVLHPEEYKLLEEALELDKRKRMKALGGVRKPIQRALKEVGIRAEIAWRLKSYYSIHIKMQRRGVELEDIYDIMALRIITSDKASCYHVMGIAHSLFVPISARFKDFIANPKTNMYQSIHTTIIGPNGEPVEIQIRTREMHRVAEEGIAAHWKYKSGKADSKPSPWDEQVKWVREVIELQTGEADAQEFMEHLKLELFENEVYSFTPAGDVIRLPADATPLDFAFAVHTDVGMHCQGAKVNGRIVPLSERLKSGNTVEILTSPNQHPNQSWLRLVKTARARSKINRYLREQQSEQSARLGHELLAREMKKARLKQPAKEKFTDLAQSFGFETIEGLYESLGRGTHSATHVIDKLLPPRTEEEATQEGFIQRLVERARSTVRGVSVQGEGNMMINFAHCCQPIPGDQILGYVTRGRGVTVHRSDCPNVLRILEEEDRMIDVTWDTEKDQAFMVGITMTAQDRMSLLGDVGRAISSLGANIRNANISSEAGEAVGRFVLEVRNLQHLQRVLKNVKKVKGVERVERLAGGIDVT